MAHDPDLQKLIETNAIYQLMARYGRAVDMLDVEGMKACFTAEGTVSFGPHDIPSHGFCDFWIQMGSGFKARHHLLGMPCVAFDGDDKAYVEAPAMVAGTKGEEGSRLRDFLECNRYTFDVVKADGQWRIASARVFITWSQGAPTSTGMETGGALDHDVTVANPAVRSLGGW